MEVKVVLLKAALKHFIYYFLESLSKLIKQLIKCYRQQNDILLKESQ